MRGPALDSFILEQSGATGLQVNKAALNPILQGGLSVLVRALWRARAHDRADRYRRVFVPLVGVPEPGCSGRQISRCPRRMDLLFPRHHVELPAGSPVPEAVSDQPPLARRLAARRSGG
jgi:hypothetical protein